MDSGDRNRRLGGAVRAHYTASAPAPVIEADLAVLTALIPRRQKRRTLFTLLALGALLAINYGGCSQSTGGPGGFQPMLIGFVLSGLVGAALFAARGAPIVLRDDKLATARALLRRIDFAAGQPLNVVANLSPQVRVVAQQYKGPGMWTNASRSTEYADEWLLLEGRLSNGIALQVTRAASFGARATRHSYVATATTTTDTVVLTYPPHMNAGLPSQGPSIAQHIQRPDGTSIEALNQPGSLSVRSSYEGPDHNRPEPLAALLAQAIALIDRSRGYVQVDRDAWPAYQPTEVELAAARP
jgi:hypothetical protein